MLTDQQVFDLSRDFILGLIKNDKWDDRLSRKYHFKDNNGNACALMNIVNMAGYGHLVQCDNHEYFDLAYTIATGRKTSCPLETAIMFVFDQPLDVKECLDEDFMVKRLQEIAYYHCLNYESEADKNVFIKNTNVESDTKVSA